MSEAPYDYDQPPGQPPPGPDPQAIKGRVTAPAIFLIVVGVLNLLAGGNMVREGIPMKTNPAAVVAEAEKQWTDEQKDQMQKLGWSPEGIIDVTANVCLWGGGLAVLVGILGIAGGARMLALRSYGLGVTGAILTAIPCVSPCCLLGQIAGIWALIVLLNSDVRSAFR